MRSTALCQFALVTYEHGFSLLFCLDYDSSVLVDSWLIAEAVRHSETVRWRTEYYAAIAFSDYE